MKQALITLGNYPERGFAHISPYVIPGGFPPGDYFKQGEIIKCRLH